MSEVIKHKAFIKTIKTESLIATIVNHSACSACHAKGMCSVADYQEKEIEIANFLKNYSEGDEVTILFKEASGFKALFFGYVAPFLLLLITLIILLSITKNETLSGLLAIAILIPYFITLYFFRHHLKKMFKFEIEETA